MTVEAILANRWVVPEKRPAFFGVALVTDVINGLLYKHLCPRAAVRIVAGGATNLHVVKFGAKQVGRALIKRLAPVKVTAEASVFNRWRQQHVFRQSGVKNLRNLEVGLLGKVQRHSLDELCVMNIVTGQATHIASIVLRAAPLKVATVPSMTEQARLVSLSRGWISGRVGLLACLGSAAGFGVLLAVAVALLALGGPRII